MFVGDHSTQWLTHLDLFDRATYKISMWQVDLFQKALAVSLYSTQASDEFNSISKFIEEVEYENEIPYYFVDFEKLIGSSGFAEGYCFLENLNGDRFELKKITLPFSCF